MTSPLVVNASPSLVHRLVPISGGLSLAGELPRRQHPDAGAGVGLPRRRATCCCSLLIADGLAADTTAAQAYIATQTDAQIAAYLRGKSADAAADDGADAAGADRRLGLRADPRRHRAADRARSPRSAPAAT